MTGRTDDVTVAVTATAYAYWALVGAVAGIGVLGLLTVGIVLVVAAGALVLPAVLVLRLPARSVVGAVGGLAAAPAFLGWTNRGGPGAVCGPAEGGIACTQVGSPWPFLAVAALLVAGCIVLVRLTRRGAGRGIVGMQEPTGQEPTRSTGWRRIVRRRLGSVRRASER